MRLWMMSLKVGRSLIYLSISVLAQSIQIFTFVDLEEKKRKQKCIENSGLMKQAFKKKIYFFKQCNPNQSRQGSLSWKLCRLLSCQINLVTFLMHNIAVLGIFSFLLIGTFLYLYFLLRLKAAYIRSLFEVVLSLKTDKF